MGGTAEPDKKTQHPRLGEVVYPSSNSDLMVVSSVDLLPQDLKAWRQILANLEAMDVRNLLLPISFK
jgi:hypothetical protein